jgi:hypothetical protein
MGVAHEPRRIVHKPRRTARLAMGVVHEPRRIVHEPRRIVHEPRRDGIVDPAEDVGAPHPSPASLSAAVIERVKKLLGKG